MANRKNTFLLKRSNIAGKIPAAGDLLLGELALNTADNILYASGTTANSILPIGWDRVARTGDTVTGNFNFFGDVKISGSSLPNGYALSVTGDTNFVGDVYVTGDLTYNGSLLVTGGTVVQSGLTANTIYTDYIDFNTGYTGATLPAGRLQWDDGNGTLILGLKGGLSDMEIGLENMALCYNDEATTLTAGTIVYVSGSQGNRPSIKRAIATGDGYSVTTLGMVSESIASGAQGFVTTFGMVNKLNTVGLSGGTPIWLSPTISGGYTTVKPQAPYHTVLLGYVVRVHDSVGSIFIQVSNGWEIDELHDVRITGATFGDLLTYSAYNGSNVWVNSKILNGSYTMTGLTVQGNTSSDLVRITQTGSGNALVVEDEANPDSTPFVINASGFIGVGTNSPSYFLDIQKPTDTGNQLVGRFLAGTNTNGSAGGIALGSTQTHAGYIYGVQTASSTGDLVFGNQYLGSYAENMRILGNGNVGIGTNSPTNKLHIKTTTDQNIGFSTGTNGGIISSFNDAATANVNLSFDASAYKYFISGVEKARIDSSGNLGIGVTSPSAKLDVSGEAKISNTLSASTLVSTQSSGDEGGDLKLATAATNNTLSGGTITVDIYQNRFRIFESGGSNRGVYIDLTAAATGVGTNLLSGGGGEINTASNLGSGTGLFAQKSAADLQFKSLTSTGGTVTISSNATTVNLEVVPASNFTGGTVNGATTFTGGLNANTISATTYQNLPTDVFVTGGTYSNGTSVFTNNTGGTFNVTGYYTGSTDVYVTGGTYSNGSLSFTNNTGGTFNVLTSTNYAAGVISGATYNSTGTGQINLPAIKVALYNNANNIEPIVVYDVASGTTGVGAIPSLVDQDTNYIVVEYNGGSPRYYVYDNDGPVDDSSVVLFMIVYRAGNFVHTLEFGNQGAGLANKLNDRFIMTDRFGYESGLALSLSASTGIVMLSSGVAWNGPNRQTITAVNSSGSTFFKNYHSGGAWTYTTTGKTINNTYYDDGTDIVSATAGKYLVNWYFRGQETNGHLYEVYSPTQYDSVALAQLSTEPALPELITSHGILVGRIIVGVNANTGLTESAFVNTFQSTNVTAHNDLSGIQGGTAGQYYHLTSNQYNNLALTNTDNLFSVSQTFNNGLKASTVSATTYYNLPTDVFVTGGTYSNGTTEFTNNTGGTFTIDGYTTPFTGGTVSGATEFTGGLSANTISATTVTADNFIGDGSGLTNVTATSAVPYGIINAIASGNFLT